MKTNFVLYTALAVLLSFSFISCEETIVKQGGVKIEFDNVVGDKNLVLNGVTYTTPSGEEFSVSALNYFVSNIRLYRADGSSFTVPKDQSYFLIKEDTKASQMVSLPQVPVGDYTGLEFVLGVDSLKSTSPLEERTGVLNPGNGEGMYWSWNSGYIFLKLEGNSPHSSTAEKFNYHIGFFGGYTEKTVNNNRTIVLPFEHPVTVSETSTPEIHLMADLLKLFTGPGVNLKIAETPNIMGNPEKAAEVANNYAQMFTVDHVH